MSAMYTAAMPPGGYNENELTNQIEAQVALGVQAMDASNGRTELVIYLTSMPDPAQAKAIQAALDAHVPSDPSSQRDFLLLEAREHYRTVLLSETWTHNGRTFRLRDEDIAYWTLLLVSARSTGQLPRNLRMLDVNGRWVSITNALTLQGYVDALAARRSRLGNVYTGVQQAITRSTLADAMFATSQYLGEPFTAQPKMAA